MRSLLQLPRPGLCMLIALVASAAEPADPLRLTRDVEPVAQAVELTLDPARDDYSGRVRVDLVFHKPSASFRLHALGPKLGEAMLTGVDGRTIPLQAAITDAELGMVTLSAPAVVPVGTYILNIGFTHRYERSGLGLYKTVSRGDPYLFTQFEDRHARKAFPCWDEPSFKIPWQLTLTVPAGLEVVSNAAPAQEKIAAGSKTVEFGRTPPMPSYLVALAVGPLEYTPVPGLSVPGRIIAPRGQSALTAEAVKIAPPLLRALETYFGIPYPYAKLDQIAVPEYVYGAMENAGLITYRASRMLLDPQRPPFDTRRSLATVTAHEMGHMWFGDLVTMEWWDDLWLNESFADWICTRVVDQVYPEFRVSFQEYNRIKVAKRSDALPSITPIRRRLTAKDDPGQLLDELTYNKGKAILRMVENWIGPEKFRAAMHGYFKKHSWGNTRAEDLWAAFDSASGENISALLAGYIERPGLPLVTFSLEPDGRLRVGQRRFLNLGVEPLPGRWEVPIVLSWSHRGRVQQARVLLREESQVVDLPGLAEADWIYPNAGESGYYRWALAPNLNTRLLSRVSALTPVERLGLLDNASALFEGGQMAGGDYLALLAAFAQDPEPEITIQVAEGLNSVRETFVRGDRLPAFKALQAALLRPALNRIGAKPAANEPPHFAPLRTRLYYSLGIHDAEPGIVATARELTNQFLQDPASVDASLAGAALAVTAFHGDAATFNRFQSAFEQADSPAARQGLVEALGSFHDADLADRALAYSLTDKMNSTEFLDVVQSVAPLPDRREQAVDWAIKNFAAIKAKAPGPYLASLIFLAGSGDVELYGKMSRFLLSPERVNQFIAKNVTKVGDGTALRARLREKEGASVDAFLATYPSRADREKR